MYKMNRGEWSELYSVLYLLANDNFNFFDHSLNVINKENVYEIKSIETVNGISYHLEDQQVYIYNYARLKFVTSKNEIRAILKTMLNKIVNVKSSKGTFEIPEIENFIDNITNGKSIKSSSGNKSDLSMKLFDHNTGRMVDLTYSIKSSLGSPSTLLNASKHTNFLYEVTQISKNDVVKINAINTRQKLIDRIEEIIKLEGKISFKKVVSQSFDYNLKMIDTGLPEFLGDILLRSYIFNQKNLDELFIELTDFVDIEMAKKKLSDFLLAISFGLIPSKKWSGANIINGGLIIVKEDGEVGILDLVYHKEQLGLYLINSTKLESPSSNRYNMLDLYQKDSSIYFTLNLQVRYRK